MIRELYYTILSTYQTDLVVKLAESRIAKSTLMATLRRVLFSDVVNKIKRLQHSIDNLGSRSRRVQC